MWSFNKFIKILKNVNKIEVTDTYIYLYHTINTNNSISSLSMMEGCLCYNQNTHSPSFSAVQSAFRYIALSENDFKKLLKLIEGLIPLKIVDTRQKEVGNANNK